MFISETHLLVRQEQYKDLQRKAARRRLIQSAGLQQSKSSARDWRIVGWIGAYMVKWGLKLQRHATASTPKVELTPALDVDC
jgi:hypothetical protein